MSRDDAEQGREDAPWDFDLPDLGASATPEHHRRRRPQAPAAPSERPSRRSSSDEPLDVEALDDDPVDQDDQDLIPHSAQELSTLGPGSSGPQLPDDVADDDLPEDVTDPAAADRGGASSASAAAPAASAAPGSARGRSVPDDDLLPAWATGRPARRRPAGRSPQTAPADAARAAERHRDEDARSAAARDGDRRHGARSGGRHGDARHDDEQYDDDRHGRGRYSGARRDDGGYDDDRYDDRYGDDRYEDERDGLDPYADARYDGGRYEDERDDLDPYADPHDDPYDDARADADGRWDDRDTAPAPVWRRALSDPRRVTRILVPLAIVLLVLALLLMGLNALLGGGDEPEQPEAPATAAAQSEDPFDGFSARPEDQTTDGASGPAARACGDDLSVRGSTDEPTYGEDQDPVLIMTLENTGDEPCMVNAGTARMDFTVTSGSDTVFDSQHCQIEGQDRPIELEPGQTESARMEWDRGRSAPGCAADQGEAAAGGYQLEVALGESSAEPVEFTLE